jgi:hypothetical protein
MATDLVTIATTAVLSQFLGPSAKHLGEQALERGKQIGSKAVAYLAAVDRAPQPIEPKLLLPLVQAASLETDEGLADRWAALLANAADPAQRVAVQPGFVEVLRQLTPTDARVAERIYQSARPEEARHPVRTRNGRDDGAAAIVDNSQEALSLDTLTIQACIDNLLRLRLCKVPEGALSGTTLNQDTFLPVHRVVPTVFGYQFLLAVAPPTP